MARQNHGPLSRAKGKLGGVVYQQYEGMQISREYQPVVKNPQTTKQTENRAKFKNASQIVAQFADTLSVRFAAKSIYERMRRSIAVRAIYGVATTSANDASSKLSDIQDAINSAAVSSIPAPTVTPGSGVDGWSIVGASGDVVTYTAVGYDDNGAVREISSETYTSDGTAKQVFVPDSSNSAYGIIMVVSARAITEDGRATISNVAQITDSFKNHITRSAAAGDVAISQLATSVYNND